MRSINSRDLCLVGSPMPGKVGIFDRDLHPGTVMKGKSKDSLLLSIAADYFLKTGNVFDVGMSAVHPLATAHRLLTRS